MKNVQIPYDLFVALLQYHLMMDDDYEDEIKHGLEQKLEAMVRHEWYREDNSSSLPLKTLRLLVFAQRFSLLQSRP